MLARTHAQSAVFALLLAAGCASSPPAGEKPAVVTPPVSSSPAALSDAPAASSASAAPEATKADEALAGWIGAYPFEESTTGFGWAYKVKIERTREGLRAHISIDGNQESMRILCSLRSSEPNRVDLLYLREEEGNLSGPRTPGEHMLTLERGADGKVVYRWAGIQSHLAPPIEGPAEIGDPSRYVGKYPAEFMAVKAVDARLLKLLGKADHGRLKEFISTQEPTKLVGDSLSMEGFYPHSGGSRSAVLVYDKKNDALHVILFDEDQEKRTDVYSERWASLPKLVEEKLTGLSRPGVKVARHTK